jgi:CDP-4-dehydro-6-deoxyglucose reductase
MPTVTLSSGKHFISVAGKSILDAGSNAHVSLPYSCKTGRCSTCKCKVSSGETAALHPETGLSEQEKAEGWILSCVRTAVTDVVIDVDDLGALPPVKTLACRIHNIQSLAPDVIKVELRLPPSATFDFVPGQYVDIIGTGGVRRSYSLASADCGAKLLELQIRAVDGGVMSDYWFTRASANDLLRFSGPFGTFFLRDVAGIDLAFLATGTGIAPVKAMIESLSTLAPDRRPKSVTVIWGGRTLVDLYFDVTELTGNHHFIPVLSRGGADWTGAKGYVQDALLEHKPDLSNTMVYACGSDAMIHSAKEVLTKAGLSAHRFYADAFVCSGTNLSN